MLAQIEHYRRRTPAGAVDFVDITHPDFDPAALGLDLYAVHKHLQVRDGGRVRVGMAAFRALWGVVPGYRWLRAFTGLPGVAWLFRAAYALFAEVRPYLPRRRAGCAAGTCGLSSHSHEP